MKEISRNQYREFAYLNREITEKVIKARRKAIQQANGKKPSNNISSKALTTLNAIFNMILETGINELCLSKSALTEILGTDKSHTNRDIKTYFKGYGLGEYSYSNKYNITIEGKNKSVVRETHYYIYINKETLELMKSIINIEGLDFNNLIEQIPECERKCNIIGAKTETEINILNYVDDEFIMKHKINVEKNLFTKEGHYSKETSVINTKDESVVEVSKKENDFIPKECEEEVFKLHESEEESNEYNPLERMTKMKPVQLKGNSELTKARLEKEEDEEELNEEDEEEDGEIDTSTRKKLSNNNYPIVRRKPIKLSGGRK